MPESSITSLTADKKQRLIGIFERLLPLIDSLSDKLRLVMFLGVLVTVWLVIWFSYFKQFSLVITAMAGFTGLIPTLILVRFWWALEELKSLPDVADRMADDVKSELQESIKSIRSSNVAKLGFLSAGKGFWSVRAMAFEAREIMGSYLSITTLVNPVMLVLGALSLVSVIFLFFIGIALVFFAG